MPCTALASVRDAALSQSSSSRQAGGPAHIIGRVSQDPIPIARPSLGEAEVEAAARTIRSGWVTQGPEVARFEAEFAWTGTADPTAYLCMAESIRYVGSLLPGGWAEVRASNHAKAVAGRRVLLQRIELEAPCPEGMVGSIASIILPGRATDDPKPVAFSDPLQGRLVVDHGIEVPVFAFGDPPQRGCCGFRRSCTTKRGSMSGWRRRC